MSGGAFTGHFHPGGECFFGEDPPTVFEAFQAIDFGADRVRPAIAEFVFAGCGEFFESGCGLCAIGGEGDFSG